MNKNQIPLSIENQAETSLLRELTEQEQEKLGGGRTSLQQSFLFGMMLLYALNSQSSQSTTKSGWFKKGSSNQQLFKDVLATDQEHHGWFMSQQWSY